MSAIGIGIGIPFRYSTSAAAFSPSDLSLAAWYDPSDTSTLWQDTAGTSPVTADGQSVARMDDKSGNGKHLTQTTGAACPLYKTSGGLHWLQFDGADDYMFRATPAFGLTTLEVFVALNEASAVGNAGIVSFAPASGNDWSSTTGLVIETGDATKSFVGFANGGDINAAISQAGATPLAVYEMTKSASSVVVRINGSGAVTDSSFSALASTHNGSLIVGGRFLSGAVAGTNHFNGRIYGIAISNAALADADRADLRTWLGAKAGLSV